MVIPNVAVVGATGVVGEVMRQVLAERDFPLRSIKFLASERSAGKTLDFRGKSYQVELLRPDPSDSPRRNSTFYPRVAV